MCGEGNLINKLVQADVAEFSLQGMINPCFQNEGDAPVYVNGRKLESGQSYSVNAPGIVLCNSIAISFDKDRSKSRALYIGYVQLTDN